MEVTEITLYSHEGYGNAQKLKSLNSSWVGRGEYMLDIMHRGS